MAEIGYALSSEEHPPLDLVLAGSIGDGMIGTTPERELLAVFDRSGGSHKPRYGQVEVQGCWFQQPHGQPVDQAALTKLLARLLPTSA